MDNFKKWTFPSMPEMLIMAPCRKDWKRVSAESSVMSPQSANDSIGQGTELNNLLDKIFSRRLLDKSCFHKAFLPVGQNMPLEGSPTCWTKHVLKRLSNLLDKTCFKKALRPVGQNTFLEGFPTCWTKHVLRRLCYRSGKA